MSFAFEDLEALVDELDRMDEAASVPQERQRDWCAAASHFDFAARKNFSWYHPEEKSWLRITESGMWEGWSVDPVERRAGLSGNWCPWHTLLNDDDAPFYQWFSGGLTNAAFSEVDLHVLENRGHEIAYVEEPDPYIQGDVQAQISRGALLARSVAAARVLNVDYELVAGDRILIYMPAGIEQITWVEACKRLGVIFCCCNPGLPAEQIADRVIVTRSKVIITVDHPDWSHIVQKALSCYLQVHHAIDVAVDKLGHFRESLEVKWANRITVPIFDPTFSGAVDLKFDDEPALLETKVLMLGSVKVPLHDFQKRLPSFVSKAETQFLEDLPVPKLELNGPEDASEVWNEYGPPVPVDANFPLFIIFTSGTTGKPKGVVHVHGYVCGLVETMKHSFNADPENDRMLTIGALGWITGQSYQIDAPLASGVTCVIMRGNPVQPSRSRFAEVIQKHKITIFKAGSAFLREVMTSQEVMQQVKNISTKSLKVATFCAEPVSEAVQSFAQNTICPEYINSYWATEHGGIAWSRRFGDKNQPLKANAHCWPMPWVEADVWTFSDASKQQGGTQGVWTAQAAELGERGDVVITNPYPYMFRYVWGDVDNFGQPGWIGDRDTMLARYWRRTQLPGKAVRWAYTQGDFAVKHADGAFTFHGRTDEVLNVNGILFGTEHIEGAILRDKQVNQKSPIAHVVVIGFPDRILGEVPMAFLTPSDPNNPPTSKDQCRLFRLVQEVVGTVNVKFIVVPELPQTYSGKFMRRLLWSIVREQASLGDQSTISNPGCIPRIKEEFAKFKRLHVC